jgi:hypothetical protein
MNDYELELKYAEHATLAAARDFLDGYPDWNLDQHMEKTCKQVGIDFDFVWFASRVLFGPAVWYVKTGKVM